MCAAFARTGDYYDGIAEDDETDDVGTRRVKAGGPLQTPFADDVCVLAREVAAQAIKVGLDGQAESETSESNT